MKTYCHFRIVLLTDVLATDGRAEDRATRVTFPPLIRVEPGDFVSPLPDEVVEGLPGQVIRSLPGQLIAPLPGQIVQPLPGQVVPGLPDQLVSPLAGQIVPRMRWPSMVLAARRSPHSGQPELIAIKPSRVPPAGNAPVRVGARSDAAATTNLHASSRVTIAK